MPTSLSVPVSPAAVRVFAGYRLPSLTREAFLEELSKTFMPGTPYMLAPLGLAAYVAAVLDLDPAAGTPEEVALIVYESRDAYSRGRNDSLQGRMYTHSHAGVFDMARSRGQFPEAVAAPSRLQGGEDRWAWHLFDTPVDWQYGWTRLLFFQRGEGLGPLHEVVLATTRASKGALAAAGVDQVIVMASPAYAAVWVHAPQPVGGDLLALGLVPAEMVPVRDVEATPHPMRVGDERVPLPPAGAAAFTFRFVRDLRHFL